MSDHTTETDTPPDSGQAAQPSFTWKAGLIILGLGIVAESLVWFVIASDRTYQVMFSMPVLSATALAMTLWWTFYSQLSWPARLGGIGLVVAGLVGFRSQYRFDGFDGAMFPRFSSRSEPTREEQLDEFLANTLAAAERPQQEPSNAATDGVDQPPVEPETPDRLVISEGDWPQYRGSHRDGVIRSGRTDFDWTATPTELWRHPVGAGWSSFAVADGRAWTQEQRGDRECVVCYDVETGQQIWEHADQVRFEEAMGGVGPRATPTVHDSRVYTVGATGQLNCLDALTGAAHWSTNILDDANVGNLEWAMSASPLIYDDLVIVVPGGSGGVAAYDRISGEKSWSDGQHQTSYAAPILATLNGVEQLLWFHGDGLSGHALNGGRELWNFEFSNQPKVNAAEPIPVDGATVVIGSGYTLGAASLKIIRDGDGESAAWSVETNWTENRRFKLKFNAPVRLGDYAYGLDEGILECIDLRDGKVQWKRGRYGYGQLLLAGETIIVQTEGGGVAFVHATPERFEELHQFDAMSATTWNHPVLWNDLLLIRNPEEAVCFRMQ